MFQKETSQFHSTTIIIGTKFWNLWFKMKNQVVSVSMLVIFFQKKYQDNSSKHYLKISIIIWLHSETRWKWGKVKSDCGRLALHSHTIWMCAVYFLICLTRGKNKYNDNRGTPTVAAVLLIYKHMFLALGFGLDDEIWFAMSKVVGSPRRFDDMFMLSFDINFSN